MPCMCSSWIVSGRAWPKPAPITLLPSASSRPSSVPVRTQPSSHSLENRQAEKSKHPLYPSSPQLPLVLPRAPRTIRAVLSHALNTLPPIATHSPTSTLPLLDHEPEHMSIRSTRHCRGRHLHRHKLCLETSLRKS